MKSWGLTELVQVSKLGHCDWPEEFTWRGRRRRVRRIDAYEPARRSGDTGVTGGERRFRLKTEDGLSCVISHDVRRDRWAVETLYATSGGA
jgi:hypothetical protein